ncbi:MAG: hypothetical protein CR217_14105 [Beijerinckiaceae bacterium]|nr:MAG: hypothetical protein CR217_14105 [Beijerinckiaceae bacterium]
MLKARKTILCIEGDCETAALIAEALVDRGFAEDVEDIEIDWFCDVVVGAEPPSLELVVRHASFDQRSPFAALPCGMGFQMEHPQDQRWGTCGNCS